jgi:DNA-directed RNA polymerase subunit beta'
LAFLDEDATINAQNAGRVRIEEAQNGASDKVVVSYELNQEAEYEIPSNARMLVKSGVKVEAGQPLTEGSLNPHGILHIQGRQACQMYLLSEVQKVYRSQGQNINDKHFEVIIRKMVSKVQITRPGDTDLLPGDLIDFLNLKHVNEGLLEEGKVPAKFVEVLLGITKASLSTESFLSASSFQHTIKVLAQAAIASTEDPLFGLKENVIIGKLIPAGTGFVRGRFATEEELPIAETIPMEELELEGAEMLPAITSLAITSLSMTSLAMTSLAAWRIPKAVLISRKLMALLRRPKALTRLKVVKIKRIKSSLALRINSW